MRDRRLTKCLWQFFVLAAAERRAAPLRASRCRFINTRLSLQTACSDKEVALRTREGHVLSFSLSSNLTSTLLDNSSVVSYGRPPHDDEQQISVLIGS